MYNNILFFFLSQHLDSLSFPTDTATQQKNKKRKGGETPNHQPNTT